jgi:hypothetical protein
MSNTRSGRDGLTSEARSCATYSGGAEDLSFTPMANQAAPRAVRVLVYLPGAQQASRSLVAELPAVAGAAARGASSGIGTGRLPAGRQARIPAVQMIVSKPEVARCRPSGLHVMALDPKGAIAFPARAPLSTS